MTFTAALSLRGASAAAILVSGFGCGPDKPQVEHGKRGPDAMTAVAAFDAGADQRVSSANPVDVGPPGSIQGGVDGNRDRSVNTASEAAGCPPRTPDNTPDAPGSGGSSAPGVDASFAIDGGAARDGARDLDASPPGRDAAHNDGAAAGRNGGAGLGGGGGGSGGVAATAPPASGSGGRGGATGGLGGLGAMGSGTGMAASGGGAPGGGGASGAIVGAVPRAGELRIAELLINPAGTDTGREWLEIVNRAERPLLLAGMHLADASNDVAIDFGTSGPPLIAPGGRVLFIQSDDPLRNGGVPLGGEIAGGTFGTLVSLNNDADQIQLCFGACASGVVLDQVVWTAGTLGSGYDGHALMIDVAERRCPATQTFGNAGSFGTPALADPPCP